MITDNYKMLKSDEQQSAEAKRQMVQLQDDIVDTIVVIVRVTLLVGFVLGATCMGIIDRVMN
jgi:hypothetical protein